MTQLISTNELQLTRQLLQSNLRLDGRTALKQRNITIQFLNKPGFIVFKIDCHACQDSFDQNKKLSVQLTKLLEKNIVGSCCLDPQSLCIVTGKYVWKVEVDFIVVNDDGNVVDAVLNSCVVALLDMRKPMVNVERNEIQIIPKKQQMLSIAHLPISMSFYFVENNIFVDATHLEELVGLTRITVTMNVYKEICSIHKPGGMGLDQETVSGTIKILEERVKEKTDWIRNAVKARSQQWAL